MSCHSPGDEDRNGPRVHKICAAGVREGPLRGLPMFCVSDGPQHIESEGGQPIFWFLLMLPLETLLFQPTLESVFVILAVHPSGNVLGTKPS